MNLCASSDWVTVRILEDDIEDHGVLLLCMYSSHC